MGWVQAYILVFTTGIHLVVGSIEKSDLVALDTKTIYSVEGNSVNILARSGEGRTIQFCRWDALNHPKIGNNGIVFVNDVDDIPSFSILALQSPDKKNRIVTGYEQFGRGLTNGECGIKIQNVTKEDLTTWKYLLIEFSKAEGNPTAVTRDVKLEVAVQPTPPVILGKNNLDKIFETDNPLLTDTSGNRHEFMNISCCTENGIPNPQLQLLLDGTNITPTSSTNGDAPGQFCIHWTGARFGRNDNGRKLKCIAEHITTTDSDISAKEDSVDLNVWYTPSLLTQLDNPSNRTIGITLLPEDSQLSLKYSANPKPSFAWYLQDSNGDYIDVTHVSKQFTTTFINPEPYIWESVLQLNTEDISNATHVFKIVSSNPGGSVDTFIVVSTIKYVNPPVAAVEDGFPLHWILVPLIMILILILLLIIFLVVARTNGWACWRNHTGKYYTKELRDEMEENGVMETRKNPDDPDDKIVYNSVMTTSEPA